jgi:hypothetical protein
VAAARFTEVGECAGRSLQPGQQRGGSVRRQARRALAGTGRRQAVVEPQTGRELPGRTAQPGAERHGEAQRLHAVRAQAQQALALAERAADQAEPAVLEIAQTAMDQLR